MQLINRVPTLRFYAQRGRRGEGEANPHIHHPFRSRWSLKFPQLPSSHLTGNISVQFLASRNRRSFARLEPRESPDQTPPQRPPQPATPGLAWPLGGQFHEAVSSGGAMSREWKLNFFQKFSLLQESPNDWCTKAWESFPCVVSQNRLPPAAKLCQTLPKPQMLQGREVKAQAFRHRQKGHASRRTDNLRSCLERPPP